MFDIPLIVTKASYEEVDFKNLKVPIIDDKAANTYPKGENILIVEPTSGFTLEHKESIIISTVLPIKPTLSFPDIKEKGFYPIMKVEKHLDLPSFNFVDRFSYIAP